MEFCNRLLQEQKVAVIPGDAFGSCAEGYIRCSYAYSKDIIKKCLEKIAVFVSQFYLKLGTGLKKISADMKAAI